MWATVQDEFQEAECGGNLPIGWLLWRVYAVNIPGYYKPVLIKSQTQMRLNVIECIRNGCWRFVHNIVLFCKMFYRMDKGFKTINIIENMLFVRFVIAEK